MSNKRMKLGNNDTTVDFETNGSIIVGDPVYGENLPVDGEEGLIFFKSGNDTGGNDSGNWIVDDDSANFSIKPVSDLTKGLVINSTGTGASLFGETLTDGQLVVNGKIKANEGVVLLGDILQYYSQNSEILRKIYSGGYIGSLKWVRFAKCKLNDLDHVDPFTMTVHISRGYNQRPSESYEICITHGWDIACMITQISGRAHYQCLKYATIRRDTTNHYAYLELYYDNTTGNGVRVVIDTTTNGGSMKWEPCFEDGGDGTPLGTVALTNGTVVQELTIGNHSSPIGEVNLASNAGTWGGGWTNNVCTLTLDPGTWVIRGWANNNTISESTIIVDITDYDGNSTYTAAEVSTSQRVGCASTAGYAECTRILKLASTTVMRMHLWFETSNSSTRYGYLRAVRIA